MFPTIRNICDIEHAIDENYFMIANRGDHVIVNYLYSSPETFPDFKDLDKQSVERIRREFRGITFDRNSGDILRRPLHKFFNMGEKPEVSFQNLDFSQKHEIMEKLDGTMICPYETSQGQLIWGTKMGLTDFSHDVAQFVSEHYEYLKFFTMLNTIKYSPIFEWTSRRNRVVIDYGSDSKLILTAIRNMYTGEYVEREELISLAEMSNIPYVQLRTEKSISEELIKEIRDCEETEGVCVKFAHSQTYLKIKAELYCQLHRVKSDIAHERGVVSLILEEKIDDLKPLLSKEDLERLELYEKEFLESISIISENLTQRINRLNVECSTRKELALGYIPNIKEWYRPIIFKFFGLDVSKVEIRACIVETILRNTMRENKFTEFRKNCDIFEGVTPWFETVSLEIE